MGVSELVVEDMDMNLADEREVGDEVRWREFDFNIEEVEDDMVVGVKLTTVVRRIAVHRGVCVCT